MARLASLPALGSFTTYVIGYVNAYRDAPPPFPIFAKKDDVTSFAEGRVGRYDITCQVVDMGDVEVELRRRRDIGEIDLVIYGVCGGFVDYGGSMGEANAGPSDSDTETVRGA